MFWGSYKLGQFATGANSFGEFMFGVSLFWSSYKVGELQSGQVSKWVSLFWALVKLGSYIWALVKLGSYYLGVSLCCGREFDGLFPNWSSC